MVLLSIRLLGEVSAVDYRGNALSIGNRRTLALVVYLALENKPSLREIGRLLFGDAVSPNDLRELVRDLRYALRFLSPEVLREDGDTLGFNREVVAVDVQRFCDLIAAPSLNSIRKATDIYRGDLLAGFSSGIAAFDAWAEDRRVATRRAAIAIFSNLLTALLRAGWWEEASDAASRLLALDPSQEVVHRTLMRLQLEQGRADAALRRYHECAEVLRRESNRTPDEETERLRADIEHALERNPALRGVTRARTNGPTLILLVEDDLVSAALIEGFLADAGYEVVTVTDGGAALIELGRRGFDLLILDINLPTLSGTKVFEIMTAKRIETPALFVTGMGGTDVETQSLEMGAAGFLRKPIQKDVLLQKIRGILERSKRDVSSRS
ncbi:MAG TPA: response regulator [Thermoanaerobaculia bacterium]|nr:response regulator [Thermoanaerobaculia bacterium]